jgi:multidrug efflux pump subunit AcrA (membrane-fusion protein)
MHDILGRPVVQIVVVAAALALGACSKSSPTPTAAARGPAPAVPVLAMKVVQPDATPTGELVGRVTAFREVPLRPQTTGFVQKILFEPGQNVKEGQLLFVIDPRPYEAGLQQARAAVADAQAAERQLLSAQLDLNASALAERLAVLHLYKALGGRWTPPS